MRKCLITLLLLNLTSEVSAENLSDLITIATSTHPAVQSKMLQVDSAMLDVDIAKWQAYPTPSINIETLERNNVDRTFLGGNRVTTLGLNQPLWTGGAISAGIDLANAKVDESYTDLEAARQTIALQVVQAYGEWLAADFKHRTWLESLDIHEALRNQVARRVEEGATSDSDLSLAEGRYESARAEVVIASAQRDVALSRLQQLTGQSFISSNLSQNESDYYPVPMDLAELLRRAEAVSPGVNKALAQVDSAGAEIENSRSALRPEIYLRLEHQNGDFNFPNFGSENRISLGIRSRFGAGLSSLRRVEESRYNQQSALFEVESQKRAVAEQVIADYSLLISFDARIEAITSSVNIAEEVSESYERQFLVGRKTWLDVMNAARDLVNTQLQLAEALASKVAVSWRLAVISSGVDVVGISNY